MDGKRVRSALCWCAAACLTVGGFVFVLAGILASADADWSHEGVLLIVLAGAALVGMIVMMSLALRIDGSGKNEDHGSPSAS